MSIVSRWRDRKWLPWPSRAEGRTRVAEAREAAEEARRKADEARQLCRDLERIRRRDHFAQAVVEGLMDAQERRGRGRG